MTKSNKLSLNFFKGFNSKKWDLILNNFNSTVNYTSWFLNYIEVLNSSSEIKNYSFILFYNKKPVAIVPLYVEVIGQNSQISMGQEPINAPIFSSSTPDEKIAKFYEFIINEVDRIAKRYDCILARFHYSPLLFNNNSENYFLKFGYGSEIVDPDWYIFKSNFSYVVDLREPIEVLIKNIRSRYRTNINRTKDKVNLIILDKLYFDERIFEKYMRLYFQVKGSKRSLEAFKLDEFAIKSGYESLLICEYKNILISAIAIHTHNKKARYNSSIQLYNVVKSIYPNHFLLKSSIEYLKKNNYELYEIGEQVSLGKSHKVSKKEENLSHFKAGWGGKLFPSIKVQKEFKNV